MIEEMEVVAITLEGNFGLVVNSEREITGVTEEDLSTAFYYPVSVPKFIILSILTLGLYELYWFFKCWRYIRERDGSTIWPTVRAILAYFTLPLLVRDIAQNHPRFKFSIPTIAILTFLFFVLNSVWNLPDPYWLVTFFTFMPLLPIVRRINRINRDRPEYLEYNSKWRLRNTLLAIFTTPIILLLVVSSFGLTPSTGVLPGNMLWSFQRQYLQEHEIVDASEEVIYFYSAGMFSIKEDGNILTDKRVISYFVDEESGELVVDSAEFSEISDIKVEYGDALSDTIVTLVFDDDSEFLLFLSTEASGDRKFLEKLETFRDSTSSGEIEIDLTSNADHSKEI